MFFFVCAVGKRKSKAKLVLVSLFSPLLFSPLFVLTSFFYIIIRVQAIEIRLLEEESERPW